MPFSKKASLVRIKDGTWADEQVGVKAPGRPNKMTFRPAVNDRNGGLFGPIISHPPQHCIGQFVTLRYCHSGIPSLVENHETLVIGYLKQLTRGRAQCRELLLSEQAKPGPP